MRFLYEDLVRSCRASLFEDLVTFAKGPGLSAWAVDIVLLPMTKQAPAAGVPTMPNLICYCSVATAACISYTDFLPPRLFGVWGFSPV
jgi:hypothetical protein